MKQLISAFAILGALTLSACAHGGHHDCCSGECKMDSTATASADKKSCCGHSDECQMKDKKSASAATPTTDTEKK